MVDPGFPRGCGNLLFCKKLQLKMKEFGTRGGAHPWRPLEPATESRRNSSNKTGCVLVHEKWRPQSLPSNNKYRSQNGLKMFMNNFPAMLKIHGMGLFDFYEFLSCVFFGEIGLSLFVTSLNINVTFPEY